MTIPLSNPYTERDAVRAPNFFNGRLLSAEDMTEDRRAQRRLLAQLGRAVGDGIAYGLEVSGVIGGSSVTDPIVTISPGLAINREGRPIELNQSVDVSLKDPGDSGDTSGSGNSSQNGAFGNCGALSTSAYAAGKGVYLLTIAPTETREGTAKASGLGKLNVCCGQKSIVDSVQFRLIRLDVSASDLNDARLRNRIAHRCFGSGTDTLGKFASNLFGTPTQGYGVIDTLRDGKLTDAEVPLALIHWVAGSGTRFIDAWAVRRRLIRPESTDRWNIAVGDRIAAEREASFRQFQAQVEAWTATTETVRATDYFDYLPSAGVLPLGGMPGQSGFIDTAFFAGLRVRKKVLYIEGSRLAALLRLAANFPPIELARRELIWTYVVRENQQAAVSAPQVKPYLVFVTGYIPNIADPRFDISKWSYANYYLNFADGL